MPVFGQGKFVGVCTASIKNLCTRNTSKQKAHSNKICQGQLVRLLILSRFNDLEK
jgi:hypothetical protein